MSPTQCPAHARAGMRRIGWLFAIAILGFGCRGYDKSVAAKCDAPLRLQMEALAKTDADSVLGVLGRTAGAIDDARRRKLEDAGARLGTVTNDLFTARVPVRRMGHVAGLDFVSSLELSQTREPLGP